jgi:integrase
VAVDAALRPLPPHVYSYEWSCLLGDAGCESRVTLHGARHGAATRALNAGLPVHQVARYLGHDAAVLLSNYAHADMDGMRRVGEALTGASG